jgi:hypothetical protein
MQSTGHDKKEEAGDLLLLKERMYQSRIVNVISLCTTNISKKAF